ncbi:hypothetical protein [Sphingopyxis sp.]|uniref:hypothetical protein n=1 Tax=Sphingopyxis sp. TaxID=1908224 RepID=UPI0025FFE47B|nr:hypothetical protein [Sphingopyxis sp.]MBK6414173.1 hypothetical protein [Sphingopyxis sp.]
MLTRLLGLKHQPKSAQDLLIDLRRELSKKPEQADPENLVNLCRTIRGNKLAEFRQNLSNEFGHFLPTSNVLISDYTDRFAIATADGVVIMGRFLDRLFPYAPKAARETFGQQLEVSNFHDWALISDEDRLRLNADWKVADSFDSTRYPEVASRLGGFRYIVVPASDIHGIVLQYNDETMFNTNVFSARPLSEMKVAMDRVVRYPYDTEKMISNISITLQSVDPEFPRIGGFRFTHIYHEHKGCFDRLELSHGMFGNFFKFAFALESDLSSISQRDRLIEQSGDPDGSFFENQMNPDTAM